MVWHFISRRISFGYESTEKRVCRLLFLLCLYLHLSPLTSFSLSLSFLPSCFLFSLSFSLSLSFLSASYTCFRYNMTEPDFTKNPRLFAGVTIPILKAEARQFPVSVHFRLIIVGPLMQFITKIMGRFMLLWCSSYILSSSLPALLLSVSPSKRTNVDYDIVAACLKKVCATSRGDEMRTFH